MDFEIKKFISTVGSKINTKLEKNLNLIEFGRYNYQAVTIITSLNRANVNSNKHCNCCKL